MDAITLLAEGFDQLHEALREDMAAVDDEGRWWQPGEGINHIGFLFWHIVRDEDNVIAFLRDKTELWKADAWHARLEMDTEEQGTGMDAQRLREFRYDPQVFQQYAEAVWERTGRELRELRESDLDKPAYHWTTGRLLTEGCLGHGWEHLGEIRYAKGLRGWRFKE